MDPLVHQLGLPALNPRTTTKPFRTLAGGHQEDEAQVLQLGGVHGPEGGEEPAQAESPLRSQAQGGHS